MSLVWPRFGVAFPNPQTTAKDHIIVSVFYPFTTASNFGKNVFHTDKEGPQSARGMTLPDPDTTEQMAARLVAALSSDKPEVAARGLGYFISGG